MKVYINKSAKLAYLPVLKNASMTFSALCEQLGWEVSQFDLLPDDCVIFSHIRDPIERHFKGTAEFLFKKKLGHLVDNADWQKVWATAVMDAHTYPITWSVGNKKDSIVWIPLGPNIDTNKLTIEFLSTHNINIDTITNVNDNIPARTELYHKLKTLWPIIDEAQTLTHFYDADIVLWCKVLEQYPNE